MEKSKQIPCSAQKDFNKKDFNEDASIHRQAARWMLAVEGAAQPDDDYFECAGWILGGMENLVTAVTACIKAPTGRSAKNVAARTALKELDDSCSFFRLSDALANLWQHHTCLRDPLGRLVHALIAEKAQGSCRRPPFAARLARIFGLDATAIELTFFAFALNQFSPLDGYFNDSLHITAFNRKMLLAKILGLNPAQTASLRLQLADMGILENSLSELRVTGNIEKLFFASGRDARKLFCEPCPKSTLPLENFLLPEEEKKHISRLLGSHGSMPVHILLYGEPGAGKTSLANALVCSLGVRAWRVTCSETDNPANTRMALCACLKLASRHPGSIVIADEAEQLLHTGYQASPKAWLNALLEKPGQKIIWICNNIDEIERSTMRRMSYSVAFHPGGIRHAVALWNSACEHTGMGKRIPVEERERFARLYPVSVAEMESALRQARTIAGKKDFIPCVERVLKAQTTLMNNGQTPVPAHNEFCDYEPAAINASLPVPDLLTRMKAIASAKRPGLGAILFYGLPGTGKSAFASYIARKMDMGVITIRPSDVLGPYVGMTEQAIARAFERAEADGDLLIIDEVDTFLACRQSASYSWERSMINEFLSRLEVFHGLCVCSTNLHDSLDPAALRRFSLKVEFSCARAEQLELLYRKILAPLAPGNPPDHIIASLIREKGLTPGDFKAVARSFWGCESLSHDALLAALLNERRLKPASDAKTVGF